MHKGTGGMWEWFALGVLRGRTRGRMVHEKMLTWTGSRGGYPSHNGGCVSTGARRGRAITYPRARTIEGTNGMLCRHGWGRGLGPFGPDTGRISESI